MTTKLGCASLIRIEDYRVVVIPVGLGGRKNRIHHEVYYHNAPCGYRRANDGMLCLCVECAASARLRHLPHMQRPCVENTMPRVHAWQIPQL